LPNDLGLSNLLTTKHFEPNNHGIPDDVDRYIRQLEILNLWILPTGPSPSNPAELLASHSMDYLLERLLNKFDYLIIDSPPVLLITDAIILANKVDGVLIVAQSEKTGRGALRRACRILTNSGGRVLGAVLNRVDARRDGYYGHYSYKRYDVYQQPTNQNRHQNS
jgi:capsular exopolysaccharide synthesis family protein